MTTTHGGRIVYQPSSLYDTRAALKDGRYRAWLGEFSFTCQRLTGVNPISDLRLAGQIRRWFCAGLTPYDAVNRRSSALRRLP